MTREDLRKEFKEMQGFWDGYHFEKSKVSEQAYAYIQWLENKVVKNCYMPDVGQRIFILFANDIIDSIHSTADKANEKMEQIKIKYPNLMGVYVRDENLL